VYPAPPGQKKREKRKEKRPLSYVSGECIKPMFLSFAAIQAAVIAFSQTPLSITPHPLRWNMHAQDLDINILLLLPH
jgi:hypothetical protein